MKLFPKGIEEYIEKYKMQEHILYWQNINFPMKKVTW